MEGLVAILFFVVIIVICLKVFTSLISFVFKNAWAIIFVVAIIAILGGFSAV